MLKVVSVLLCLLTLSSAGLSFISAAETQSGAAQPFDADWRFALGDPEGAQSETFDDADWRVLNLPHDWSIEGDYSEEAASGGAGGYLPTGIGWYRKSFTLPESDRGKKITIRFGGIYQKSTVWINGVELGYRPYGYSEFHYDLTDHLKFGESPNLIAVRVDNSQQPNSRWYSGSGIYRRVWLTITDPLHIPEWGTYVVTERADSERADLRIRVKVTNGRDLTQRIELRNEIIDQAGQIVAEQEIQLRLAARETIECDRVISVAEPKLWSDSNPNLYSLRSSLWVDGKEVDFYVTRIGIRVIDFDVDRGLLVNGKQVKMRGMCLHHDGGAVGAAVPKAIWARRLALLKEMGCNAIRMSHNPMASELYDLCDEMGFYVMDEAFDEWTIRKPQIEYGYSDSFYEWYEKDLVELLHRNRNHPSIVMWSAGNEIGEQWEEHGPRIVEKLVDVFHREDPTRPVTAAMDNIFTFRGQAPLEFSGKLDVVGYNYVDRWDTRRETHYADDRHRFPERKFVGTENSSAKGVRGVYEFGPLEAPGVRKEGYGPEGALYLGNTIRAAELWRFVANHDYVSGDFAWTGFDYLGESRWPRKLAPAGPLDTCGFKKDSFYFYQSIWTEEPMIHLLPHWNWPERKGQVVPVVVYSNCDVVELFVNGKSFGAKAKRFPRDGFSEGWNQYDKPVLRSSTVDMQLVWDVPYEEGEVKAVGYVKGKPVVDMSIRTAGEATRLVVQVDRQEILADGRDVAHVVVKAVDAEGNFVPTASNVIRFEVTGAGRLIGVDSGNPASHESYKSEQRKLFSGMALGLVQSTGVEGNVEVRVSGMGIESSFVEIHAFQ